MAEKKQAKKIKSGERSTETKSLVFTPPFEFDKRPAGRLGKLYKQNFESQGMWITENRKKLDSDFSVLCDEIQYLLRSSYEEQKRCAGETPRADTRGNAKKKLHALCKALDDVGKIATIYLKAGFYRTEETAGKDLDETYSACTHAVKRLHESAVTGLEFFNKEPSRGGTNKTSWEDAYFICSAAWLYRRFFYNQPAAENTELAREDFKKFLQIVCDAASPRKDFAYSTRNIAAGIDLYLFSEGR